MTKLYISARLLAKLLKYAPTSLLAEVLNYNGVTCLYKETGAEVE